MSGSADSLLISLAGIFVPSIAISFFIYAYSWKILKRYRKALARLYKVSFGGIDTERIRIANLLHDHAGSQRLAIDETIETLKSGATDDQLRSINALESKLQVFLYETGTLVEHLYPKELLRNNWEKSFKQLAEQLTTGTFDVNYENNAIAFPPKTLLHHAYWAVKEKITNAARHAGAKTIQLSSYQDGDTFLIVIVYKATPNAKRWIKKNEKSDLGRGTFIIKHRLDLIGAENKPTISDGYIIDLIKIRYEHSNS